MARSTPVEAAKVATAVTFYFNGFVFATWAGRLATTRGELGLTPGQLGLLLIAGTAGSLVGLPFSGPLAARFGTGAVVRAGACLLLGGSVLVGPLIETLHSVPLVAPCLFFMMLGVGLWDVSMNLEGAAVEQRLGRTVMPRFHAAFSLGTVSGAILAAGLSGLSTPLTVHFVAVAVPIVVIVLLAVGRFLPETTATGPAEDEPESVWTAGRAWRDRRTLLIGVVVLAAAFTEGTAYDWLTIAFVDGHHVPEWAGILALAIFLSAMTAGRVLGVRALDRHGRVPVVRVLFVLAILGNLLVVFGGLWLAFVGAAIWGLGAALGFPSGISAAAEDPRRAAVRVSVVSTISYTAFLMGPPLLGFLGDHVGVLNALSAIVVIALLAIVLVPVLREERPVRPLGGSG